MLSSISVYEPGVFWSAFLGCTSLERVNLKKLSYVDSNNAMKAMFSGCTNLELVDFSEATAIPNMQSSDMFDNTNEKFKVLVPAHLYASWKSAANWSTYASHIVPYGFVFSVDSGTYAQISLYKHGNAPTVHLDYSLDNGSTWTYWADTSTPIVLDGVNHTMVSLRSSEEHGPNTAFGTSASDYNQFMLEDDEGSQSVSISAFGSATFLLDKDYATSATLPDYCFYHLFESNYGLATAPELPSTSLGQYCYSGMFKDCSTLERGPELPATTLATGCYNEMFSGCYQFNHVKIGYTGNFSTDYFYNWLYDVASEGDVIYSGSDATRGPSAIPVGWNQFHGLKFTAKEANSTVGMVKSEASSPNVSLEYSVDEGVSWSPFVVGTTTVTLANIDDEMYLRAISTNATMSNGYSTQYNKFVMTGQIAASGNINSLLNKEIDDVSTTAPQNAYVSLFRGCTSLVDAKNLTLPCTATSANSYGYMFYGCSNLVSGPEIFATTLGNYSLEHMFDGCSVLNEVKLHYTGTINGGPFGSWMTGVQTTAGTFYYNGSSTTHGTSAIPNNWTITPFS